jgi:uncharacterized protein YcfJ
MAEEAQRTNGLFIPYPLLALIMTMALALGGGLIGLYAQVSTMNATILMRDSDRADQLKKLENKLELTNEYVRDLREKQIRQEEREKKGRGAG